MTQYLVIGNGRVANHLIRYLTLLGFTPKQWHRQSTLNFYDLADAADKVLLCISDSAIESFYEKNRTQLQGKAVHFSGAKRFAAIPGAHPLTTFRSGTDLYEIEAYKKIPFITESGAPSLTELLPGFPNPAFVIAPEHKGLYHAACVMAGNFTTLLWQNSFDVFEKELGLPREALNSYLQQTLANLQKNPDSALTGPMVRGDIPTLVQNLDALSDRPEQKIYYAFLNFFLEKKQKMGDLNYERLNI